MEAVVYLIQDAPDYPAIAEILRVRREWAGDGKIQERL
jgi:hypothetical protein